MNSYLPAAILLIISVVTRVSFGQQFLGRTAEQWKQELSSSTGQQRVHAAWAMAQLAGRASAGSGDKISFSDLVKLVNDADPTVRFWGVQALALFAPRSGVTVAGQSEIASTLEPLLADRSPAPRIAAALALGTLGQTEKGLPVLVAAMSDPQESVRIQAVAALEKLGPAARPAVATLEAATSDSSEYVKRISERALATLDPARKPPEPKAKAGKAKTKAKSKL